MRTTSITAQPGSTLHRPDTFDVERVRRDFPILQRTINGKPLVYLDNAATGQKPQAVIDTISRYYTAQNANIHRGVHRLSVDATAAYEGARAKVQRFMGAARPEEIIFVRSATEAINLVAQAYARPTLKPGDEVLISTMEHHSNIVPWQIVCEQTGSVLRVVPINDAGEYMFEEYEQLLSSRTRLVAVTHVSNALGTINPVRRIIEAAHQRDIPVLVDGAQAAPHLAIDVKELDCDFYAISGHKMFGPSGIGALYGKYELLDDMPPYQGGGEMILSVSFEGTVYNNVPHKFEAGTPNIAGAIGLGATVDYLQQIGLDNIAAYEHELLVYAREALSAVPDVRLIGTAKHKAAVLSFLVGDIHPHDVGTILDLEGIAVRTGHHCAQPVMQRFGITATVRASLALYNTTAEIDALVAGVGKVRKVFG
ncbi:MAG: cysteine desulfurase [Planctomycetota bacterium]|nr:cysteine desulfurase [Planctomycetota bacterium]MCZ6851645.1 cysteine desulfurase [Planctomycetota bacterium]